MEEVAQIWRVWPSVFSVKLAVCLEVDEIIFLLSKDMTQVTTLSVNALATLSLFSTTCD